MSVLSNPGVCAGRRAATLAAACIVAALAGVSGCGSGDEGSSAGASPGFRSVSPLAGAVDAGGHGYVDGPAAQARFDVPSGVAVADDGAVWISEAGAKRIRRMDPDGRVETVVADVGAVSIGKDAAGRPLLLGRTGPMAAAPGGAVYVAAEQVSDGPGSDVDERWVVLRVSRDGSVAPVMRSSRPRAARAALGLSVDRAGRLLVSDAHCAVWRAAPGPGVAEAQLLHHLAGTAEAPDCSGMDGVTSVTTDPQGRVVYSVMGGSVQRLESDGSVTLLARGSAPGYGCSGMAYDRSGRLLLNTGGYQLRVLDAQGLRPWAGDAKEDGWFDGPGATARFGLPCGLAMNASGYVAFVADAGAGTLRRIDADGRVTTLAGRARQAAFVDADGMEARFGSPLSLGSGLSGGLLAPDALLGLVRHIDADGRVKTIAGQLGRAAPEASLDRPASEATFAFPHRAVVAGDGGLWIGEYLSVRRLGADGMVRRMALADGLVRLMAVDAHGDVLVWASINLTGAPGDPWTEGLWRFAANATPGSKPTPVPMRWQAGLPRWEVGPNGMCAAEDGTVYLSYGHALMRSAPDGQASVWAGDVELPGAADGVAAGARFNQPAGLVCEGRGVYVADSGNHTVRHVDDQGHVRTVLGRAGERGVPDGSVPGLLDAPGSLARVPGGIAVSTGLGVVIAHH